MTPSETEHFLDKVCAFLSAEGKRCTPLRQNILRVLFEGSGVSVKELKFLLDERYACEASEQALYGNVELFEMLHLVAKRYDHGAVKYALRSKRNRFRLVCTRCGRSVEDHEHGMIDTIRLKCREWRFELADVDMTLQGICERCRNDND